MRKVHRMKTVANNTGHGKGKVRGEKRFHRMYTWMMDYIDDHMKSSADGHLMLTTLIGLFAYTNWANGTSFPSTLTLAKKVHLSQRSIARGLNRLQEIGLLVVHSGKGAGIANQYILADNEAEAEMIARGEHLGSASVTDTSATVTDRVRQQKPQVPDSKKEIALINSDNKLNKKLEKIETEAKADSAPHLGLGVPHGGATASQAEGAQNGSEMPLNGHKSLTVISRLSDASNVDEKRTQARIVTYPRLKRAAQEPDIAAMMGEALRKGTWRLYRHESEFAAGENIHHWQSYWDLVERLGFRRAA